MGESGLDATERHELAGLRARAYGPDAEGSLDPAAAARLAELETAERGAADAASAPPPPGRAARERGIESGDAAEEVPPRSARSTTPGSGGRRRGHAVAIAVVAIAGLVLAGAAAVRTAVEAAPAVVTRLSADPASPEFLVGGSTSPPPTFPIAEDMQWSAPLGTVLGWDVWVGRSRSNFACLAVVRSSTVRADCVSPADFGRSGATIYLPPNDVAVDLRPAGLIGSAAVAYRWSPDRSVTVQVEQ